MEHIFGGWDHLVFVLTLALAVGSWKRLALVVTSFTMAHSLTLAMTAVGLVRVSPALVEPAIAATIVWAAVDLFRDRDREPRLGLTFAFGLIHGLGFGGTMLDLGLEGQELLMPLLGFNLGVEAGQLLAVLPAFALFAWLSSHRPEIFAKVQSGGAIVCGLAGAAWLVARIV